MNHPSSDKIETNPFPIIKPIPLYTHGNQSMLDTMVAFVLSGDDADAFQRYTWWIVVFTKTALLGVVIKSKRIEIQ